MASDLETPFGFATFLACATNFKKVFIPGTYNMSNLLKALPKQESTYLVCDSDFYSLQAPPSGDYEQICSQVTHVLIAGQKGKTELFSKADAQSVDPVSMQ
jgi:hypothetical protein